MTISEVRAALKSENVCAEGLDDVCNKAITKLMTTEWLHREFTDEEIKNAMRACSEELKSGYYEFV